MENSQECRDEEGVYIDEGGVYIKGANNETCKKFK